jgi:DNA (cytosine-5)-methyltransferase 1
LDLYCCQGGAARGYQLAGFEVFGVDIASQPRYVGDRFRCGDAIETLRAVVRDGGIWETGLGMHRFDAVHASPPCQIYKKGTLRTTRPVHDLIGPTRDLLNSVGLPWVIENVMDAPLDPDRSIVLCANTFGLRTYRHRRFEYGKHLELVAPEHLPHVKRAPNRRRRERWLAGDHASITGDVGTYVGPEAMNIDWMTGNGLSEAIPPAYTEWVGRQLMAHLRAEVAS